MNHSTLPVPDGAATARPRDELTVLDTELRTLQERLIILRARDAALELKIRQQAQELEKYATALFGLTEEMRKNQNLNLSYQDHLGFNLVRRGRYLLDRFHHANLRGRMRIRMRITELLEFQADLSQAAYKHADWGTVRAQLERVATGGWPPLLEGGVLTRGLRQFLRRCVGLAPVP